METVEKIATKNKPLSLTGKSFPKIIVGHRYDSVIQTVANHIQLIN